MIFFWMNLSRYEYIEAESLMLIPEKAVLGVFCSYYQNNHINLDLSFTFTFITQSGHFWIKKKNKLDSFSNPQLSPTPSLFSAYADFQQNSERSLNW